MAYYLNLDSHRLLYADGNSRSHTLLLEWRYAHRLAHSTPQTRCPIKLCLIISVALAAVSMPHAPTFTTKLITAATLGASLYQNSPKLNYDVDSHRAAVDFASMLANKPTNY